MNEWVKNIVINKNTQIPYHGQGFSVLEYHYKILKCKLRYYTRKNIELGI